MAVNAVKVVSTPAECLYFVIPISDCLVQYRGKPQEVQLSRMPKRHLHLGQRINDHRTI